MRKGKMMFKIGDFSKLSRVPVKTLRYYANIGLLEPAQVDRFTNYRYYTVDQLPRLNRILALRELGFSLEQIGRMLDDALSAEQMRGMFRLKQAEVEQQVEAERARLQQIEMRLRQIEQEGKMPKYDVVMKKIEPLRVVTVRDTIPTYEDMGLLMSKLHASLQASSGQPVGPPFAIYHDPEYKEHEPDIEVAIPIMGGSDAGEAVTIREIDGVEEMATVMVHGPYDQLGEAYTTAMQWLEANNYQLCGPSREIYLTDPGTAEPEDYMTEIQFPVTKA